jgi:hypothetical protein
LQFPDADPQSAPLGKALLSALVLPVSALAQEHITFPTEDGGVVSADVYGSGERGVVLAHGGRFTKESWQKQAEVLVHAGFRALAIDFRGRGAWASIEVRRRRVRARRRASEARLPPMPQLRLSQVKSIG